MVALDFVPVQVGSNSEDRGCCLYFGWMQKGLLREESRLVSSIKWKLLNILFRIVGGICKYPRIESPLNSVTAQYDNPVLIGDCEFFIKQYFPLLVEQLSLAMSMECLSCTIVA